MKVLYLLTTSKYSGAENVVCQIIHMLKNEDKIECIYCSPDGEIKDTLKEKNITFFPLKKMSLKEIKNAIKETNPDIIHAHDMRASFLASLVCGKIPLISHIHNNSFESRKITLKSMLYYYAARKSKHIFWVSQSAFKGYFFYKNFKNKSSVLYNVIDIKTLENKALSDKNTYNYEIVYLGRITYPKNPERLLEVIEKILKIRQNTKIAIIGTGELEEKLKVTLKENSIFLNVSFLGFQKNPYKILKEAKVMLMTSRWEGTPMCVLESMSLGTPVVSTPVDGIKDLIKNNVNGFLSNNDDDLANKICEILEDKDNYNFLSRNAKKDMIRLMNIENYKMKILNEYNLLNKEGSPKYDSV